MWLHTFVSHTLSHPRGDWTAGLQLATGGLTLGLQPPLPQCTYISYGATVTADTCEFTVTPPLAGPPRVRTTLSHVREAIVVDGWVGSTFVGNYTSQLQAYLDTAYAPVSKADFDGISLFNSTNLRALHLRGAYLCDMPLRLPSMFVLHAYGMTLTPAANLSLIKVPEFRAMLMMDHVTLSAVIGGTFDASSLPPPPEGSRGYQAISIVGGYLGLGKNAVRRVRALANNTDAIIGISQSPNAEVSFSDVGGGGASGMLRGRCIWLRATRSALVHHNLVRNCTSHSLDFDAYTSHSAAYSNELLDHGQARRPLSRPNPPHPPTSTSTSTTPRYHRRHHHHRTVIYAGRFSRHRRASLSKRRPAATSSSTTRSAARPRVSVSTRTS